MNLNNIKETSLKINLHILEPCNYKCKHCFAHFDNKNYYQPTNGAK